MTIPGPRRFGIGALLRRRCPRCGEGAIFEGLWTMNERCPVCAVRFDRDDPGHFTGAMYFSYALGVPLIALLTLIEWLFLPGWSLFRLVLVATVVCIPLVPWLWQYSRVFWIYFDRYFDPEDPAER